MKNKMDKDYLEKIKEESSLWDKAAEDELKKGPPDYSYLVASFKNLPER